MTDLDTAAPEVNGEATPQAPAPVFTPDDLNPAARRYYDDISQFVQAVKEFDASDTSGPSGSRRVINSELVEQAQQDEHYQAFVDGTLQFLLDRSPTEALGMFLAVSRAFEDSEGGKAAEEAVKALVEERKKASEGMPEVVVDYTERNNNVVAANALVLLLKSLGGEAGSYLANQIKIPNQKSQATRAATGPRLKGNWQFNWAGKLQATKLADVQKATGLSGLELKERMAKACNIDTSDEEKFKKFLADAPSEFQFNVEIALVKDQPPTSVTVTAVRQDSDDTPELEANSEATPEDDNESADDL